MRGARAHVDAACDAGARRRLLLGTAVLVIARLALELPRPGPVFVSDEIGYLTNARVLSGGIGADLLTTSFYRGGYSAVLAPAVALTDDPELGYRLALAVNVALAASVFPLLYLLLTRCLGVRARSALGPAFAAACYPALTPTSGLALSENLLFPLVVVWLLCFGEAVMASEERRRASWLAGASLSAAALWATHGRMAVVVALSAVTMLVLLARGRITVATAGAALAVLLFGWVAAHELNDFLIDQNYGGRSFDEAETRLSALVHPDEWPAIARTLLGHTWYLLVGTLGLALAVVALDARRSFRAIARGAFGAGDLVEGLVVLTALGLVTVSALSFTEIRRPDMLVYGRYVESIAPPLVAIGLVRLAAAPRRPREAVLVAALILLTAGVVVLRTAVEPPDPTGVLNVQALPLRGNLSGRSLLLCGLAAALVLWVLVLVGRRRPWALVPVALLMFVPTAAATQNDLRRSSRALYPSGWSSPAAVVERLGLERVGYDTDGDDDPATRDRGNVLPWLLPRTVVVRFSGRGQPPPTRYVISSASWRRQHPALASEAAWIDRADDRVLWHVTGPAQALRPLEACLRAAGLRFRPDTKPATGGAELVVDLPRGRRARVIVYAQASDAAEAERGVRRLLRAGGTAARGDVVRRGGTIVIYPTGVASADRRALSRCAQATRAGTAVR